MTDSGLRPVGRVEVVHLFPEERLHLLEFLRGFIKSAEQWKLPTVCPGWSVGDIARHLLGDDLGRLSRVRDGFREASQAEPGEDLVLLVNRLNEQWVTALRRLSQSVVCNLLEITGEWTQAHFATLELGAIGSPVSWAGPDPAPVWLDIAREYTERWHHQQHIRDAVGQPGQTDPRFLHPVLATFAYALPAALHDTDAPVGTIAHFHVHGEAGGDWSVERQPNGWQLYTGVPATAAARVDLDQDRAWRLYTKGITSPEAERHVRIQGDDHLARVALRMVSVIA